LVNTDVFGQSAEVRINEVLLYSSMHNFYVCVGGF